MRIINKLPPILKDEFPTKMARIKQENSNFESNNK